MDKGFFGGLFDFDHDGRLDSFERAADLGAFVNMMDTKDNELVDDDESMFSHDLDADLDLDYYNGNE